MVDPHVEPVAFAEGSKAEVIVEVHPPNRRMRTRMYGGVALADRELSRSEHCFAERLLCSAWASAAGRTLLAISAEPPYADPHVRWCGRGEWATTPPMPIVISRSTPAWALSMPFRRSSRLFEVVG
jgi:hypothetical protein